MPGFIKQIIIALVLVLFCFGGSLVIDCLSISNQQCMVRPKLIDLNPDELYYYPFIINMSRCVGSSNTIEDPYGRIFVPSQMEDVNMALFNIIKEINESRTLTKFISCECRCEFNGRKCNLRQKWNNNKCQCHCKKPIKHRACKEDYTWNFSTCACECSKDCKMLDRL